MITRAVWAFCAFSSLVALADAPVAPLLRVHESVVYDATRGQFLVAGTEFRVLTRATGAVVWRAPFPADRLGVAQGRVWLPHVTSGSTATLKATDVAHARVEVSCDVKFDVHPEANTLRVDVFERNDRTWARWLSFRDQPSGGVVPTPATQQQAHKRFVDSLSGGVLELRVESARCVATPGDAQAAGVADSVRLGRPHQDLPAPALLPPGTAPRAMVETRAAGSSGSDRWVQIDELVVWPEAGERSWRAPFRRYRVLPPRP